MLSTNIHINHLQPLCILYAHNPINGKLLDKTVDDMVGAPAPISSSAYWLILLIWQLSSDSSCLGDVSL